MRASRKGGPGLRAARIALLAVGVGVGCGESGDVRPERAERTGRAAGTDSAVLIEDPSPAWEADRTLELVREIPGRAVAPTGDDGVGRGLSAVGVRDVAPAAGGRVLVLDGERSRVALLGDDGRLLRRVGRAGQGPGELRSPGRVEEGVSGAVLVFGRRPPTIHRWDSNGRFVGRRRLRLGAGAADAGGIAEWGRRIPEGRGVRILTLDPADPSGGHSSVFVADSGARLGEPVVSWRREGTESRLPKVFGARRSWAAGVTEEGTGRVVVARGDRYELRSYDLSGRLRTLLRRNAERIKVTKRLRRRALDRFVEEARRGGAPDAMTERLRGRLPVADRLPAIAEIWASPGGGIWVGVPGKGEPGGPPSVVRAYDVFRPDFAYLGRVSAPAGFRLHRVGRNRLYGSWRNELGVPGVRVYRLRPRRP